ncbi:Cell cycle serine/threonine-protein kinase cdc5/MSD2 [Ranunculus cassubicifolius]
MKTIMKGGVWKNMDDEILKTAITKYGKNQWDRIASLFSGRKSSQQCKSRWNEYLDPSIKKLDWTREEDERLLHLAKLYPSQWRTIASLAGRTSFQCIQRYNKLLDSVHENLDLDDDLGKFRVGEIDPNMESRPARKDPVDMEEDEKDMLREVVARVANTKGKKAKRKQREKLLEEATRLARMQKLRELKAAGIDNKKRKRNGGVDYNAEIVFEKKAPLGFYDVSEDDENNVSVEEMRFPVSIDELEGKRRIDEEAKLRKKDGVGSKILRREDEPVFSVETSRKRAKLVLPAPCISDFEWQEMGTGLVQKVPSSKSDGSAGKVERLRSLRSSLSNLPQPN